ncbi:tyrosine-type recombinase/integrase [Conexibacter sp. JD483]|uniref:tyrosine-type recombinase/integrase n=1 Tax=unclassified Conexibacter TaxID=2627773 RepID=UPI00271B4B9E|nr:MULTISPECIES: tyrosine-type recombinase/integrase [unclassified Conexibacter]MDO8185975.1 tyrosine-type recombinase/integrase [Conexibacter sp. CPCC 205706]MDO8199466.1 tyrosine-type recombinase/integrase [Conexibacter sp. CPCC 205762]MDR9368584.1 tyrosine-type recombinase/integrase [Conexibacter sp. JD483]
MSAVVPAIVIAFSQQSETAFYEAKWRDRDGRQVKRRLGRAWVERGVNGAGWRRRRGRTPAGWLDERTVHVAAAELVERVEQERAEDAAARARATAVTFRRVAHEWLEWRREVKGGAPSTLRDNEALLREPGAPHKRGAGVSPGRIMARFGDVPPAAVTTRDVSRFLRELDRSGIAPKTVNKYRELLHAIFNYAMRSDTYGDLLRRNPVTETDKRRQPPPAPLDHYERDEIEALVRVCEQGRHRAPRHYRGRPVVESPDEQAAQAAEDRQDAAAFALMFYSGLRLGELLALRWRSVRFLADLSGAIVTVDRAVSAGIEKPPKSGRPRDVPVARPAAEAVARLGQRPEFTSPDDYVFCNRFGDRLDGSALRRGYKRAAAAADLRPIRLHGLRHAAGSDLARNGVPLITIRDFYGHASLTTTNRYLHSKLDEDAVAAMNAAHGIGSR